MKGYHSIPEPISPAARKIFVAPYRILQISIGFGLGAFSLFFVGPEMKRADASVSPWQEIAGVIVLAGAYFTISLLAARDIRWSSLLAICFVLLSTPLFGFLWLMSGWSMPSAEAARPLLYYVGGDGVLFATSLFALIRLVTAKAWAYTR